MGRRRLPRKPGPTKRKRPLDVTLPGDCPRPTRAAHARLVLAVERAVVQAGGSERRFLDLLLLSLDDTEAEEAAPRLAFPALPG